VLLQMSLRGEKIESTPHKGKGKSTLSVRGHGIGGKHVKSLAMWLVANQNECSSLYQYRFSSSLDRESTHGILYT